MKKKISAILITALLLTASAVPVFAGTYTEDGTASALVTAEVISSYSIVLPAAITLTDPDEDGTYTGAYTIGAKGNINVAKKLACAPTTPTFTMTGNNGTNVMASVSQTIRAWVNSNSPASGQKSINDTESGGTFDNYSTVEGAVSAPISHAGTYSGNMEFTFGLTDL